jgi:hypothetical protein
MASEGKNFVWCEEMVELATGPTPEINERHMCSKGEGHVTEHECSCGFTWATAEAPC